MPESTRRSAEAMLGLGLALLMASALPAVAGNAYPTSTTVDYVLGCMAANGNTREAMLKCSCSIDFIAKRLPYPEYEKAETALSLQQGGGDGARAGLVRVGGGHVEALPQVHLPHAGGGMAVRA